MTTTRSLVLRETTPWTVATEPTAPTAEPGRTRVQITRWSFSFRSVYCEPMSVANYIRTLASERKRAAYWPPAAVFTRLPATPRICRPVGSSFRFRYLRGSYHRGPLRNIPVPSCGLHHRPGTLAG